MPFFDDKLFGKAVRARLTLILQYSSLFNQFYPYAIYIGEFSRKA